MGMAEYRSSEAEQQRTSDLLSLMPVSGDTALDIGARDGHFSRLLAKHFRKVIALDLEKPKFEYPDVVCIEGNVSYLPFPDNHVEFVFCAEVLEHIPMPQLKTACDEIQRASSDRILIGVPYKQDIRLGRTTCSACGGKNPPWGHVNTFDETYLSELFPLFEIERINFVGTTRANTNWLSVALMDYAGNPYGTYDQEETCIFCGSKLGNPAKRNIAQLISTKLAFWVQAVGNLFVSPRGNWIHILFRKKPLPNALEQPK